MEELKDYLENESHEEKFFNDLKKFIKECVRNNSDRLKKKNEQRTLIGFLTKKRIFSSPDGKYYAEFVIEFHKNIALVFECVAYDEIAEKIARNYSTGDQLAITGRLNKNKHEYHSKTILVVDSCTLIKSKNEQSEEIKEELK